MVLIHREVGCVPSGTKKLIFTNTSAMNNGPGAVNHVISFVIACFPLPLLYTRELYIAHYNE